MLVVSKTSITQFPRFDEIHNLVGMATENSAIHQQYHLAKLKHLSSWVDPLTPPSSYLQQFHGCRHMEELLFQPLRLRWHRPENAAGRLKSCEEKSLSFRHEMENNETYGGFPYEYIEISEKLLYHELINKHKSKYIYIYVSQIYIYIYMYMYPKYIIIYIYI